MGIKDWFRKKPEAKPKPTENPIQLPELDKNALLEETLMAFESDETTLELDEAVEATPEYDAGEVEIDALLDDEMESNYDLNTVSETDIEDLLEGAEIIGDVSQEVDFESTNDQSS